jgi:pyruvate formate lyase activating enzyme
MELLLEDALLYETSGGGVTFSGGEPTLRMDYVAEVARALKGHNLNTALQTSGMFDLADFRRQLLPHLDLVHYDLKLMDAPLHRQFTGRSNTRILRNLAALASEKAVRIQVRTPLVPGITDTESNLSAIKHLLNDLGIAEHILLPYNPGGVSKRISLGRRPPRLTRNRSLPLNPGKRPSEG